MMRVAVAMVLLVVVSALAAVAFDGGGERRAAAAVSITQTPAGDVSVGYALNRPVRALAFRSVEGGYRERRWSPASPDFVMSPR